MQQNPNEPAQVVVTPSTPADATLDEPREIPKLACDPGTSPLAAPAAEPTWFCAREGGTRHGAFITLFPDGTIEVTGAYKDGKLHGVWQRNHANGTIAEQGAYVDGHKEGRWKQSTTLGATLGEYDMTGGTGTERRWFDNGALYSEQPLVASVPHGTSKIFAPDGTVVVSSRFYKGKLDGPHTVGTKNTLRIEETFANGTRINKRTIWQFWLLLLEERYDRRGRFDGPYVMWRSKKTPRFKGDYEHGKKVGPWVWNDRADNKEREGTYVNGKRDGVWQEWYENKLTFTGTYVNGKPDGEFVYNDRNGNELGRFEMKDGTGTMLTFHSNRKPASKERLYKGARDGVYQELTFRGKVVVEGHHSNDVKWGSWKEWTPEGVPVLEENYRRGKLDGVVKKFVDGKVAMQATYKDGKVEGPYLESREGKPAVTGQFVNDLRTGTWTQYDPTGSVVLVSTYKDGVLDGAWRQLSAGVVIEGTMAAGRRTGTWTRTDKAGVVRKLSYKTP
ncbi:MAG: hypothetical protein H0T79_08525 [Deltaproteobacteria bacterium]|nr:hypothetical protein [Deltaproteobacteria bacterium]